MAELHSGQVDIERDFLKEVGYSLNSALFIIDRLSEELRKEDGLLENDPEVGRLFVHLISNLEKVDSLVKDRRQYLSEKLDTEMATEEKNKKERSADSPSR